MHFSHFNISVNNACKEVKWNYSGPSPCAIFFCNSEFAKGEFSRKVNLRK